MIDVGREVKLMAWGEDSVYKSKIADYNENEFMVEYPVDVETGKSGLFPRGTFFEIILLGKDKVLYKFPSELKAKINDNIPLYVLEKPSTTSIERIQRREYVRVPDSIKSSMFVGGGVTPAETIDISAGGMSVKVLSESGLQIGSLLDCKFVLPAPCLEIMTLRCQVVRLTDEGCYKKVCLKFEDMNDIDMRKITKYVFSRQVELRKLGFL